jgi:hypothetical protein
MNRETAITQAGLNATNQITPDGSLTYSQNGTWADGTPRFTATTSLTPEAQKIFNTNQITKQNIANIGKDQSARIGDLLGTPIKLGNEATESRLFELGSKRLDPMFAQRQQQLEANLANKGIQQGSAAYTAAMRDFDSGRNDAYNQLLLTGRGQANQELMAERNAPINEISALMSGSQVSNPNFVNTPQTPVAGVDYTGLVRDNYNAQMQGYNAQLGQQNAMMGGLFGLGGTIGGMGIYKYSDRRLKSDIRRVGALDNGLPVYVYKIGGETELGVMADEVEVAIPDAVAIDHQGYRMVDYSRVVGG